MTEEFDNTNSGALFKNDRKETERHPDYRGEINVEGKDFWISSWLKTSKNGVKFMSLAVSPKEIVDDVDADEEPPADFDDDIPF